MRASSPELPPKEPAILPCYMPLRPTLEQLDGIDIDRPTDFPGDGLTFERRSQAREHLVQGPAVSALQQ